jgi:hypothetical protein
MIDVAAGTAEHEALEREDLVLRLGAVGRGRAEIAAALGMSRAQLAAREAEDASLAVALQQAADLALAWWEAAPCEAFEAGVRFNYGAWRREMAWRFGETAPPDLAPPKAARARAERRETATCLIPCNGRTKLRPDGTCPCGAYHNEEFWRARDEQWRAENPDDDFDPSDDNEEMTDDD